MASKTTDWRPGPTVCRCCLSEGCYKDIATEYFWMGKREVYAEMLSETFSLSIAFSQSGGPNSNSRLICEPCISRLRDASDFRRQVQECEKTFMNYLDPGSSVTDLDVTVESVEAEVKVECVKLENDGSDDDFEDRVALQEDEDDEDDMDDQPLTKLVSKVTKKESVDVMELLDGTKSGEKRKTSAKAKASATKKSKGEKKVKATSSKQPKPEKKKKDTQLADPTTKDWYKIVKYRGPGPALREDSLKLLKYSTGCVFQWTKSIKCFCCKVGFSDLESLRDHTKNEHTLEDIERRIIAIKNRLVKFEITVLNCKICFQKTENLKTLRSHLTEKHSINFVSSQDLLLPFKINENLQCQICFEKFNSFWVLNVHTSKHYPEHISRSSFSKSILLNSRKNAHDSSVHGLVVKKKLRYPCPYCPQRFFQKEFRSQHLEENHGMTKPQLKRNVKSRSYPGAKRCSATGPLKLGGPSNSGAPKS